MAFEPRVPVNCSVIKVFPTQNYPAKPASNGKAARQAQSVLTLLLELADGQRRIVRFDAQYMPSPKEGAKIDVRLPASVYGVVYGSNVG